MKTFYALLVRFGLWLAGLGGWTVTVCARAHAPESALVDHAKAIVADLDVRYVDAPNEIKRREALRILLNLYAGTKERDLNFAIEAALQ